MSGSTEPLDIESLPLDELDPPSLTRASTCSSTHYFSELEDLEPLLGELPLPDPDGIPATLGKRPFSALDSGPDTPTKPVGPSWHTEHPGRPYLERRDSKDSHLAPVVIAHVPGATVTHLPYGVQWELARICSSGSLKTSGALLSEKLNKLDVPCNMQGVTALRDCLGIPAAVGANLSTREREAKLPWKELDLEEELLSRDPYGGLGGNVDSPKPIGRIHFTAILHLGTSGTATARSTFELRLETPTLGSSNRLARRFGSSAILRVRVPDDLRYTIETAKYGSDDLISFFLRPFVVHHHVFRAFYAKDSHIFLFRTRERYTRKSVDLLHASDPFKSGADLSLEELISWHNKLEGNQGQSMTKWASRFALALSNSVPGLRVDEGCIHEVNDIVCNAYDRRGKVPGQMVMTDGCGATSRNVLKALTQQLGWSGEPTTIQMRLAGAKGLLLADHAHAPSDPFHISLRPSQIKIDLSSMEHPMDPAMLVIDVIKPGRLSTPSRLSEETIINMAENGVPLQSFVNLMNEDLQQRVDGLTQWTPPASVFSLYRNVAQADGVITQRLIREAAGMARAKGYTSRDVEEQDKEEDEDGLDELDELIKEQSTAWWADPTSGCPSTISETVLVLLDSGFTPDTCPVLASKLKHTVRTVITQCKNKCHISVPMSCTAFVVPDPCNVLAPNEVHVKSSSRNLKDQDGMATDLVLGEVLVTRHPCKVPTDVQKVTAVYKTELSSYVDVVVVSTRNHCFNGQPLDRHLASMTGGGDYDGDTLEVFWEPSLVSHFSNADPRFAEEPKNVQASLRKNPESVRQFLARTAASSSDIKLVETQKYLLGSLRNVSRVGTYSNYWLASAYRNGYTHPDTIFLAYMFTNILDGAKTGVTVADALFEEHKKKFRSLPLPWILEQKQLKNKSGLVADDTVPLKRNPGLPPFALELLHRELMKECIALEKQLDHLFPEKDARTKVPLDKHLAAPWEEAVARADLVAATREDRWMQKELGAIRKHVADVYVLHKQKVKGISAAHARRSRTSSGAGRSRAGAKKNKGGASFTDRPIEQRQDIFRELSKTFEDGPTALPDGSALLCFDRPAIRRLRASYAYILDREESWGGWSRFPWDVAMRTLCEIKVEALGGGKTLTEEFYYKMNIPKSFVKQA